MAMTLLMTESFAIIARGSPVRKLTPMPATLTASIRPARTFTPDRPAMLMIDLTAGPTLLRASDSHRLAPSPRSK